MSEGVGPAGIFADHDFLLKSVESRFRIREYFLREDGSIEFHLHPQSSDKANFRSLLADLKPRGLIAFFRRVDDDYVLAAGRSQYRARYRRRPFVILLAATLGTVFADGFFRSSSGYSYGGFSPLQMAVFYTLGLMGILGIHELGHKLAARRHGMRSSLPYFIPGIPTVLPTMGAIIVTGEPTVNRDSLFDLGISGPLAGLLVAILVTIPGALTSVQIGEKEAEALVRAGTLLPLNFIFLVEIVVRAVGMNPPGTILVMSPVLFAGWLGFLITFLNLLPAWQLDGGHMARAALGRRAHRIATLASVAVLIALDYLIMALFILLFSARSIDYRPLDDVSPLSRRRKLILAGIAAVALVIAPVPPWLGALLRQLPL